MEHLQLLFSGKKKSVSLTFKEKKLFSFQGKETKSSADDFQLKHIKLNTTCMSAKNFGDCLPFSATGNKLKQNNRYAGLQTITYANRSKVVRNQKKIDWW